jgi:hypothetical protein
MAEATAKAMLELMADATAEVMAEATANVLMLLQFSHCLEPD